MALTLRLSDDVQTELNKIQSVLDQKTQSKTIEFIIVDYLKLRQEKTDLETENKKITDRLKYFRGAHKQKIQADLYYENQLNLLIDFIKE